jgi:hypothetical protein
MVVGTTKHDKKQLSNDGSNVWDSPKKKSGEFYSSRGRWEPLVKTHLVHIVNSKDDGESLLIMC